MNIREAVIEAQKIGGYITNAGDAYHRNLVFIEPTDGLNCCIVHLSSERSRRGWQPCMSELISEAWEVVTKEDFLVLSKLNNLF